MGVRVLLLLMILLVPTFLCCLPLAEAVGRHDGGAQSRVPDVRVAVRRRLATAPHAAAEASVWIGIAAVVLLVGLTMWEALAEH